MYELIRVGQERLIGEIIRLENDSATIQASLETDVTLSFCGRIFLCYTRMQGLGSLLYALDIHAVVSALEYLYGLHEQACCNEQPEARIADILSTHQCTRTKLPSCGDSNGADMEADVQVLHQKANGCCAIS